MLLNWSETGQLVIPVFFFVFFFPPSLSPQYSEEQGAVSSDRTEGNPGNDDL